MPSYHTAYLLSGSNVGDRFRHLILAEKFLSGKLKIVQLSPIYHTSPWGKMPQQSYLNRVIKVNTLMGPFQLLNFLSHVEKLFGRKGKGQMLPRKLDLDILFYDGTFIKSKKLIVPHPRIVKRRFVLQPLADIAPDLTDPISGISVNEMLVNCHDRGVVRKFEQ